MRGPLGNIMQQAQKMQESMKRAQEDLANIEVTGSAGGGMVSVTMNGRHEARRVTIDKALLGDDIEMLEDLIVAAFKDAKAKMDADAAQQMEALTAGMGLPAGMKLPF